jgi:adenylyl- and sulfurtransferase ThiI
MGAFIIPPYDLQCPSVQTEQVKRCRSVCGIYHASVKSTVNHAKVHRKSSSSALIPQLEEKKRPVRVAATRQRDDGYSSRPVEKRIGRVA